MLSVIVPVYNAENYLVRCLDSLLEQGVDDYEIICVNDGSTDNSLEILREYESKTPSVIKIVEQKNSGLPAARNVGMLVAQGDVFAFCDADDYLVSNAYGYLIKHYWKEGIDVLHFDSTTLDKYVLNGWKEPNNIEAQIVYEGDGYGFYRRAMPYFVWQNLYRKSFIVKHKIEFRTLPNCEDTAFNLDVFIHNPYTLYVNADIYRYTVSSNQLTRRRDKSFACKVVDGYLTLFGMMNVYSKQIPLMKSTLDLYKEQQMVPCMSRALSAKYSKSEWKSLVLALENIGILPMRLLGNVSIVVNSVMSCYFLYILASFLYRKFFVPFVLPNLSRN